MANHLPVFLLKYSGVWNDVTDDVSQGDPLTISTGGAEVSDALKASKVELTFEDPDGVYRVHDPSSPLYGLAGRNTPLYVAEDVLTETFESSPLGISVSAGSSANAWARSTTSPHSGSWCFKSGATANGAFSDAIITVPTGANLCIFWYRTDSSATDVLRVSSRSQDRFSVGGTGGTWTQVAVPCPPTSAGVRELYLRYQKDASGSAGADAVYVDDLRFMFSRAAVEISSWRPDRTLGFGPGKGRQWCSVTAEGLLRRVGSWTEVLQSAMTRAILGWPGLLGFWPGEDGRSATAMSNLTTGAPATVTEVTFGDEESPGGGSTSVALDTASVLSGAFLAGSTTGWQVSWSFRLAAIPALAATQPLMRWSTSNGYTWVIGVTSTTYTIDVTDRLGVSVLGSAISFGTGAEPNQWITMRFMASVSGGTVTYELGWYPEGAPVIYFAGSTFAGSLGRLQSWRVTGNAYLNDGWLAYVYAVTGTTDDVLVDDITQSFNGFADETAGDRFVRLMGEEGLAYTLAGASADTELMGPQRPDRLYELLRECRDTDGGLMHDSQGEVGITMRTRQSIYGQSPALELTYGVDVADPLTPELDDLGTANQVTATQRDGGSATATDTTSSMSILPPPLGVGVYKKDVDVNVSDESRLEQIAAWWRGQGTVPDARYSSVTVDLDANPELEADAQRVAPGDRLTIADLDPDLIDLMVLSAMDRQANQKRRTITYACLPYRQYEVAEYDDATKRYDSLTSTLNASYSSTASPMVVTFTNRDDAWSTVSEPYDWMVAGERITVTSMGAVTGSGPYTQSATVTRSINGVVKAQTAAAPVHIATPGRYAL